MFKILGQGNEEYDPVSADGLRQWIAERRANAQTKVQREGTTEFISLGEIPEFQPALAQAAALSRSSPTQSPTTPGKRSSGLAIASLIFGVASFTCLPFLAALPAIVMGHIALSRSRRDPIHYGGAGFATAGLVLGYIVSAFLLITGVTLLKSDVMMGALAKAKARAQQLNCVANLREIGMAARSYANDHHDVFPTNFLSMSKDLSSPTVLMCPGDTNRSRAVGWNQFSEPANVSYEFLTRGETVNQSPEKLIFRCPIHGSAAVADGSVLP